MFSGSNSKINGTGFMGSNLGKSTGSSIFGVNSQSGDSLFGTSVSNNTGKHTKSDIGTNSLFGNSLQASVFGPRGDSTGPKSLYGQQDTSKPNLGFGQSTSNEISIFGKNTNSSSQNQSMFGSTDSRPNLPASQNLFGQRIGGSLFNQPPSSFRGSMTAALKGTKKKTYCATTDAATGGKIVSVTAMPEYSNFFIEELRLEDYKAGHMLEGIQTNRDSGNTFFSGTNPNVSTGGSIFGSTTLSPESGTSNQIGSNIVNSPPSTFQSSFSRDGNSSIIPTFFGSQNTQSQNPSVTPLFGGQHTSLQANKGLFGDAAKYASNPAKGSLFGGSTFSSSQNINPVANQIPSTCAFPLTRDLSSSSKSIFGPVSMQQGANHQLSGTTAASFGFNGTKSLFGNSPIPSTNPSSSPFGEIQRNQANACQQGSIFTGSAMNISAPLPGSSNFNSTNQKTSLFGATGSSLLQSNGPNTSQLFGNSASSSFIASTGISPTPLPAFGQPSSNQPVSSSNASGALTREFSLFGGSNPTRAGNSLFAMPSVVNNTSSAIQNSGIGCGIGTLFNNTLDNPRIFNVSNHSLETNFGNDHRSGQPRCIVPLSSGKYSGTGSFSDEGATILSRLPPPPRPSGLLLPGTVDKAITAYLWKPEPTSIHSMAHSNNVYSKRRSSVDADYKLDSRRQTSNEDKNKINALKPRYSSNSQRSSLTTSPKPRLSDGHISLRPRFTPREMFAGLQEGESSQKQGNAESLFRDELSFIEFPHRDIPETEKQTVTDRRLITCHDPDIRLRPALSELNSMTKQELGAVNEFAVVHKDYGRITFEGFTDVNGLDISRIVSFSRGSVSLYADTQIPIDPRGSGLNKTAVVELNVRPKLGHIDDDKKIRGYVQNLKALTESMHAEFISYDLKVWKFRIHGVES